MLVLLLFFMGAFANNWKESSHAEKFRAEAIAKIVVIPNSNGDTVAPTPSGWDVQYPDYLSDLTSVTPDVFASKGHGCGFTLPEDLTPEWSIEQGQIFELKTGSYAHPVHIHVNHMQITSLDSDTEYLKVGDWWDTIRLSGKVSINTTDYPGLWIMHCHYPHHSDLGCAALLEVGSDYPSPEPIYYAANRTFAEQWKQPDRNLKDADQELSYPAIVSWEDFSDGNVETTLYMDTSYYDGPHAQYHIRSYNGGSPGPIIRIKRGTTMTIHLHNLLDELDDQPTEWNKISSPNKTNLHTHGLHIDPWVPGDNVIGTKVYPQNAHTYVYNIPENHMGGTFWYHPHYHGSGGMQTATSHGTIIVEDEPEDGLPDWLTNAEEKILMFTVHPQVVDDLQWLEEKAGGNLVYNLASQDYVLLNGLYMPRITLEAHKWYRFRMIMGSMNYYLGLRLLDCDVRLLALDGVYVSDAPRILPDYWRLASGNRVDVAVMCSTEGTFDMLSDPAVAGAPQSSSDPLVIILVCVAVVLVCCSGGLWWYFKGCNCKFADDGKVADPTMVVNDPAAGTTNSGGGDIESKMNEL